MKKQDIIDAWKEIRKTSSTIPDDVLDFMKDCAVRQLEAIEEEQRYIKEECEIIGGLSLPQWKSVRTLYKNAILAGGPEAVSFEIITALRKRGEELGVKFDET